MTATVDTLFSRFGLFARKGHRNGGRGRKVTATLAQPRRANKSRATVVAENPHGIVFELVTSPKQFEALEADWNDLFQRAARASHVFQSFGFLWHWCTAYHAPVPEPVIENGRQRSPKEQIAKRPQLAILTGRRKGRLDFVWPLVLERRSGLRTLSWMGEPVAQYGDCLIDPEIADLDGLEAAYAALHARVGFDVLHLRRVRADARIAPLMQKIAATSGDLRQAPFVKFDNAETFDAFEQRYPGKKRANRRRQARRLSEKHNYRIIRPGEGQEARALACRAIEMKTEWLAERGLFSPAYTSPAFKTFFANAAEGKGKSAACAVSALMVDNQPAAIDINFWAGGMGHLHVLVYDPAFEKHAVGVLLLEDQLRYACDGRQTGFDFLAPAMRYKDEWSSGAVNILDWSKPVTLQGMIYAHLYLGVIRPMLRNVAQSLPSGIRQRLSRSSLKQSED